MDVGEFMQEHFPKRDAGYVILKYWHIILLLTVQMVGLGIAYGEIKQSQDDMARRLVNLENNKLVTREEFDAWRTEFHDDLQRIESAIINRNREEEK